MNRWAQEFNSHPIHATLKELISLASTKFEAIEPAVIPEQRRLLKVISLYQETLKKLDPELTPFSQLTALNNSLVQHPRTPALQYSTSGNSAYLTQANNFLSDQLVYLSYILPTSLKARTLKPTRTLEKLVDSTAESILEKKSQLENELETLSESINERQAELEVEFTSFSQSLTERKTELEKELMTFSENIEELNELVETRKQNTDLLISEWQQQFSESQDKRSNDFSSWKEKVNDKATASTTAVIQKTKSRLDDQTNKFDKKIDDFLSDAENKHQAILELYGLAAGDSVAGGYLENANQEAKQADSWRKISILFIFFTVGWLGFYALGPNSDLPLNIHASMTSNTPDATADTSAAIPNMNETSVAAGASNFINWLPKLLVTFSLSGVLLWGSAYAAQQSTRHRNNEKRTRWFALEIKAIDPFISSLSPEQQSMLKTQLSERLFAQSSSPEKETSVIDEHAFKLFGDLIAKVLGKLPKT